MKPKINKKIVDMWIGYILLSPCLFSALLFLCELIELVDNYNLVDVWTGNYRNSKGGGNTLALPLYFGLMAIIGVYLIKDSKTKEETVVKPEKKEG